jgi:hypothetical protein
MAGDWIKMEVGLPEKPEVWQIAGMVGIDADAVVGKLLKVWRWFDAHTEDGNAHGVTYALVDHVAGVTGFGEAMAMCAWLEQDGSLLRLPNFDRHNGKTAKNRALTAKRVAQYKAKGNDASVTSALPREEKRREEEKKEEKPSRGKGAKGKASEQTLKAWLGALDGDVVPADDPIFDWAQEVQLPREWIALAWWAFEDRYYHDAKRYTDWRAVFRRALRGDWLKLWRRDARSNDWVLTTAGEQARLQMEACA